MDLNSKQYSNGGIWAKDAFKGYRLRLCGMLADFSRK